jgi:phosphatidylglycerol:prolipoprotein diacylglycerol transferase
MNNWINPVLLSIGPLNIHWYGLMYAVAFLIGYLYFHYSKHGKSLALSGDQKDIFLMSVIGGVLIGGRVGYILFYNLPYYLQNPLKIFAVWEGGMSFHGGLLELEWETVELLLQRS